MSQLGCIGSEENKLQKQKGPWSLGEGRAEVTHVGGRGQRKERQAWACSGEGERAHLQNPLFQKIETLSPLSNTPHFPSPHIYAPDLSSFLILVSAKTHVVGTQTAESLGIVWVWGGGGWG